MIDDLYGESEVEETVEYAIDGVAYEIALSRDHAEALREVFAPSTEGGYHPIRVRPWTPEVPS